MHFDDGATCREILIIAQTNISRIFTADWWCSFRLNPDLTIMTYKTQELSDQTGEGQGFKHAVTETMDWVNKWPKLAINMFDIVVDLLLMRWFLMYITKTFFPEGGWAVIERRGDMGAKCDQEWLQEAVSCIRQCPSRKKTEVKILFSKINIIFCYSSLSYFKYIYLQLIITIIELSR